MAGNNQRYGFPATQSQPGQVSYGLQGLDSPTTFGIMPIQPYGMPVSVQQSFNAPDLSNFSGFPPAFASDQLNYAAQISPGNQWFGNSVQPYDNLGLQFHRGQTSGELLHAGHLRQVEELNRAAQPDQSTQTYQNSQWAKASQVSQAGHSTYQSSQVLQAGQPIETYQLNGAILPHTMDQPNQGNLTDFCGQPPQVYRSIQADTSQRPESKRAPTGVLPNAGGRNGQAHNEIAKSNLADTSTWTVPGGGYYPSAELVCVDKLSLPDQVLLAGEVTSPNQAFPADMTCEGPAKTHGSPLIGSPPIGVQCAQMPEVSGGDTAHNESPCYGLAPGNPSSTNTHSYSLQLVNSILEFPYPSSALYYAERDGILLAESLLGLFQFYVIQTKPFRSAARNLQLPPLGQSIKNVTIECCLLEPDHVREYACLIFEIAMGKLNYEYLLMKIAMHVSSCAETALAELESEGYVWLGSALPNQSEEPQPVYDNQTAVTESVRNYAFSDGQAETFGALSLEESQDLRARNTSKPQADTPKSTLNTAKGVRRRKRATDKVAGTGVAKKPRVKTEQSKPRKVNEVGQDEKLLLPVKLWLESCAEK